MKIRLTFGACAIAILALTALAFAGHPRTQQASPGQLGIEIELPPNKKVTIEPYALSTTDSKDGVFDRGFVLRAYLVFTPAAGNPQTHSVDYMNQPNMSATTPTDLSDMVINNTGPAPAGRDGPSVRIWAWNKQATGTTPMYGESEITLASANAVQGYYKRVVAEGHPDPGPYDPNFNYTPGADKDWDDIYFEIKVEAPGP